jgi:AraC-like DNA-binding protein/quercetin dioxygenase-like cupin family protein
MSKKRQRVAQEEDAFSVRSLSLELPTGFSLSAHSHEWPQFIYASKGVLTVTVDGSDRSGTWVVPSHRGVWVPARIEHRLETTGETLFRTLYLNPSLCPQVPDGCCVMGVTPLLRELILEIASRRTLKRRVPEESRLAHVLVDQLASTTEVPLDLTWPQDSRARRVANALNTDLAVNRPLSDIAQGSGASVRTLERLFLIETGVNLGQWRQRARLLHALRMLASGESVTSVALAVGYDSTSAFIAAFKRSLGATPGSYFKRESS